MVLLHLTCYLSVKTGYDFRLGHKLVDFVFEVMFVGKVMGIELFEGHLCGK